MASAGTNATEAARGKRCRHEAGGGAALQQRRYEHAAEKCCESVAKGSAEQPAQVGAERPHDAAVDHVESPEQQRHAAEQIEEKEIRHKFLTRRTNR